MLTLLEEASLIAACDHLRRHLKPLIAFAVETGLRARRNSNALLVKRRSGEALHQSRIAEFQDAEVPFGTFVARALETLAQLWQNSRRSQSAFVFGPSDFKRAFNGACAEAGLSDVHFHDLRHTAITRMLEKGISPPLVMKISGHSQQKTFLRYVNQTESSIYDIAMKLDRAGFDQGKPDLRVAMAF